MKKRDIPLLSAPLVVEMLQSLHSLQQENQRLQDQILSLTAKKERLQLLNTELAVSFPHVHSTQNSLHASAQISFLSSTQGQIFLLTTFTWSHVASVFPCPPPPPSNSPTFIYHQYTSVYYSFCHSLDSNWCENAECVKPACCRFLPCVCASLFPRPPEQQ